MSLRTAYAKEVYEDTWKCDAHPWLRMPDKYSKQLVEHPEDSMRVTGLLLRTELSDDCTVYSAST
jgi:hypothetical protein